tara:strand:- start:11234 stop:11992 length:759 start_codon:yes stop_codon:yes gene_type:complete
MDNIDIVLWDLDGTIADTEIFGHLPAFNKAFKFFQLNWFWSEIEYIQLLNIHGGFNRISFYSRSKGFNFDKSFLLKIHQKKQIFYQEIIQSNQLKLRTGVLRLVEELHSNKIKQAIVTSSERTNAFNIIKSLFKSKAYIFDFIITSEDVVLKKPNPESYLKAINQSNCNPSKSIAIEDSFIGLSAAKSAGLKCLLSVSPWLMLSQIDISQSDIAVNHLGDSKNHSSFYNGNKCQSDFVDYPLLLELIIQRSS